MPSKFLIGVFSGNIKLGSSGEYEIKEINNIIPTNAIIIPNISINLLNAKSRAVLVIFFMFILDESNLDDYELCQVDLNSDGSINVLDVITMTNIILDF